MTMNEQINAIYVNKKSTTTNKQKFLLHILETEVIILSSFPKPVMGKFGYIYEIPRVHCKIKECQIDDCLTNGSRETKTSWPVTEVPSIRGCFHHRFFNKVRKQKIDSLHFSLN